MRARLYVDSARRLNARQVLGRGRRLVPPRLLALGTETASHVSWHPIAQGLGVNAAPASGPTTPPEEAGAFHAIGASRAFPAERFWTDPADGLLFLFHLHGFEQLARYAADDRTPAGDRFWENVVRDWLETQRSPKLPAWHPFPTSIRIVAWAATLSTKGWPDELASDMALSLYRQARYLRRSVEHDLGGNHLLKNAVALVIVGCVMPDAGVRGPGLRLLRREVSRQILADGGHEERSTSYHREVVRDLSDAARALDRAGHDTPQWLKHAIVAARGWLGIIAGPDGSLPLLNDAWEGPSVEAEHVNGVRHLEDSGYVVLGSGNGDRAIFDVGPIGAPHLTGHAHADVLSFVYWADGEPLIVDPGAFAYTGPMRDRFRSTAAHNTVQVDGRDQCEFWSDFRAAYLPRVEDVLVRQHGEIIVVAASHDGYRRLADPVTHKRALVWWPGAGIVVVDLLEARHPHRIRSALHLAPGIHAGFSLRVGSFGVEALGPGAHPRGRQGLYSPYLGSTVEAPVVEDERTIEPGVPFGWSVLRGKARVKDLARDRLVLALDDSEISLRLPWG